MAEQITVIIVLQKTVETTTEAKDIYQLVKQRFADKPDIEVSGRVTNQLADEPE